MKKMTMTNLFLTLAVIVSLLLPTATPAMAAAQCKCISVTERIKEQFLKECKVTLLKGEQLQFEGQYQLKKRKSKEFLEILRSNIPEKKWNMIKKASDEKKLVFLFEEDASKKVWIFRCNICGTIYLLPLPFNTGSVNDGNSESNTGNSGNNSSSNGGNTGNSGNNSSSNGGNAGNSGNNSSNNVNNSGNSGNNTGNNSGNTGNNNTGDNSSDEKLDPEKPSLKKIDTSGWRFENVKFVYDGNSHRPILTGVPAELQKELKFEWSTNGETDAGKYSASLSVKVPEEFEKIPDMRVEFEIEEAEFNPSKVTWDQISFHYNGKGQAPTPVGLPADAEIVSATEAKVNAGENYHHELEVKIPNYKEFTLSTEYDITPAQLSPKHQYDETTGEVITVVEGLIKQEDIDKLVNFVNGNEQDNVSIKEPGEYNVKTEITLDSSVKNNYISAATGDLVAENNYVAKRAESLYHITIENIKNEDGTVKVMIYISDVRIPFDRDEDAITLAFNVGYDKDSLQYGYGDDDFAFGSDEWGGEYNPDRDPTNEDEAEEHDIVLDFYGELPTEKTLVCTLGYQIIGDSENIEFSIINPELSSGMSEYEFSYTTDDEKVVINKNEDYIEPEVIKVNWDLQKDAQYQGADEDEEEAAREALQEYFNEEFSKDNTSVSSISLEQEEATAQEEASTDDIKDSSLKETDEQEDTSSEYEEGTSEKVQTDNETDSSQQEVDSSSEENNEDVEQNETSSNDEESQTEEQPSNEEAQPSDEGKAEAKEDQEEQSDSEPELEQEEKKEEQQPEEK